MQPKIPHRKDLQGFSLLEMLVALAILSMTLVALYQAISGATRSVRTDERYVFGVELARSLLVDYGSVSHQGGSWEGETEGGFVWTVEASPVDIPPEILFPGALQKIEIAVAWTDGSRSGNFDLSSVVEGLPPTLAQGEVIP